MLVSDFLLGLESHVLFYFIDLIFDYQNVLSDLDFVTFDLDTLRTQELNFLFVNLLDINQL